MCGPVHDRLQRSLPVTRLIRLALIGVLCMSGCGADPASVDGGGGAGDQPVLDQGANTDRDSGNGLDGQSADGDRQAQCTTLGQKYLSTLSLARACNPMINTPQCDELIDDRLDCPCETHVNQLNINEIQELKSLQEQWTSMGCPTGITCTGAACPGPGQGVCRESTSGARCEDEAL